MTDITNTTTAAAAAAAMDPVILAVFGPAPANVDLGQSQLVPNSIATVFCTAVAIAAVVLRMWARGIQRSGGGGMSMAADDWLLIIGLVFVLGTVGLAIGGCSYGAGRHVWAITHQDLGMTFKLLFSYTYVWSASVSATKLSVLLFYKRIFARGATSWFRVRLWIVAFLCTGYPLTCWLYMALACQPASFFWTQFLGAEDKCGDTNSAFMALTVVNMVNDIAVLCVPIPEIVALQMSQKRKVGVAGIMLLGSFVCVASVVRITTFASFMTTVDKTWDLGSFFLWSSIEPAVGVLCACLPTLKPLPSRFRGGTLWSSSSPASVSDKASIPKGKIVVRPDVHVT